ncbi:MAG: hypothetical protein ACOCZQ_00515 [Nanoarchaeota archaeon]
MERQNPERAVGEETLEEFMDNAPEETKAGLQIALEDVRAKGREVALVSSQT